MSRNVKKARQPLWSNSLGMIAAGFAIIGLSACAGPSLSDAAFPEVSLAGLGLTGAGLAEQNFTIELRLKNPNAFDIPVESLNFDLDVAGSSFAKGLSDESFTLPASAEIVVPIRIAIATEDLIQRVSTLGTGKRLDYRLSGAAEIDSWFTNPTIPFNRAGKLAFPDFQSLLVGGKTAG